MRFFKSFTVVILAWCFALSCKMPIGDQREVTESSSSSTYEENTVPGDLYSRAYMGGSLLYNPQDPSSGHIRNGVEVAIRLGKVTQEVESSGEVIYEDKNDESVYGIIKVISVNSNSLNISYKLEAFSGRGLNNGTVRLNVSQSVDLDGDSIPDIEYINPSKTRSGMEGAKFLRFISSQETLTTSMYCVTPSGGSRGLYPGGLMGINPNGKFLYTMYGLDNSSRSQVSNVQPDDYVFDGKQGVFLKAKYSVGSRSLNNSDLTTMNDDSTLKLYKLNDFEGDSLQVLLKKLREIRIYNSIRECSNEDAVIELNKIILDKSLVQNLSEKYNTNIPDQDLSGILAYLNTASQNEVVDFNRDLMNKVFPELSVSIVNMGDSLVEILPLVHCYYGDRDEEDSYLDSNGSRAASKSSYESEKKKIEKDFKSYYNFHNLKIPKIKDKSGKFSLNLGHAKAKLGAKGSFSITWSRLKSGVHTAILIQADTDADIVGKFSHNLVNVSKSATYPIPIAGPVVLNLVAKAEFKLPITVKATAKVNSDIHFTGLYGAGFDLQAKWGAKWSGPWYRRRFKPYFKKSASGKTVNKTAYYLGTKKPSLEFKDASISLNPTGKLIGNVNLNSIVYAEIVETVGLENVISAKKENRDLVCRGSSDLFLQTHFDAGIKVKIPIFGTQKWNKKVVLARYDKNLGKTVIFRKRL